MSWTPPASRERRRGRQSSSCSGDTCTSKPPNARSSSAAPRSPRQSTRSRTRSSSSAGCVAGRGGDGGGSRRPPRRTGPGGNFLRSITQTSSRVPQAATTGSRAVGSARASRDAAPVLGGGRFVSGPGGGDYAGAVAEYPRPWPSRKRGGRLGSSCAAAPVPTGAASRAAGAFADYWGVMEPNSPRDIRLRLSIEEGSDIDRVLGLITSKVERGVDAAARSGGGQAAEDHRRRGRGRWPGLRGGVCPHARHAGFRRACDRRRRNVAAHDGGARPRRRGGRPRRRAVPPVQAARRRRRHRRRHGRRSGPRPPFGQQPVAVGAAARRTTSAGGAGGGRARASIPSQCRHRRDRRSTVPR